MRIVWSRQALSDRDTIWEFVASDDLFTAQRIDTEFASTVDELAEYPELGRPGLVPGTRELFPVPNYRIVYELNDDEIWILAIVHTS